VDGAANGSSETTFTDAAACSNISKAQIVTFAKSGPDHCSSPATRRWAEEVQTVTLPKSRGTDTKNKRLEDGK